MRRHICIAVLASFLLSGCITFFESGPDYEGPPEIAAPDTWNHKLGAQFSSGSSELAQWWTKLNDPVLDGLIEQSSRGSFDLRIALSRIDEARAQYGVAAADYYPGLDASGSAIRKSTSASVTRVPSVTDNFESAGIASSWEIDLFGRISRSTEAAEADIDAFVENHRDVQVALYAEIARNYIEARALQKRRALAHKNVKIQTESTKIVRARFEADLVSKLDVYQAEQNLAASQSDIPLLNASLNRTMNRLSALLGQAPGDVYKIMLEPEPIPSIPNEIVVAIPRDVLRQRPDIRTAERQLAAQTARIGIATADLYPRLSLFGDFGYSAGSGSLFDSTANLWSFGPSLSWSIFSGGANQARIKVQDARTEQARIFYEKTVIEAFEEVENALSDYNQEKQRLVYLNKSVEAAQNTITIARVQYKEGLTNFQTVLDAERVLFAQEDRLANSQGTLVRYLVTIYRAMGGGWDHDQMVSEQPKTAIH